MFLLRTSYSYPLVYLTNLISEDLYVHLQIHYLLRQPSLTFLQSLITHQFPSKHSHKIAYFLEHLLFHRSPHFLYFAT